MAEYHIFDMDHTLLENDCDVSWKEFCVAEGIAPESDIAESDRFFQLYLAGKLDFQEFVAFQLKEFCGRTVSEMEQFAAAHFEKMVKHLIRPKAFEYVRRLLDEGKKCAVLTSTNTVLAKPVGEFFGIDEVIGASLELSGNIYTGRITGIYTAGEGKAEVVRELSIRSGIPLSDFAAYGDSINDLPMLKTVGKPFAVTPGASLAAEAEKRGFEILDWSL